MNIQLSLENILNECGICGLVLLAAMVILFFVQFWFYAVRYARIVSWQRDPAEGAGESPVSVVTVIGGSDYLYLEQTLPLILAQQGVAFEVALVDISGDEDFGEALKLAALADGRINLTRLAANPKFPISNKMALNVAIKAARYENIILSTTDAYPPGERWLAEMSAGFSGADIVIGFSHMEKKRGRGNMIIRQSQLASGMRWLSAALKGRPYRGTIHNLGITKKIYFEHNGFNHLNLNIGEEDLFVQYIVPQARTSVVISRDSIVRQRQWSGLKWWNRGRLLGSNAFRFYDGWPRRYISWELWSRFLYFVLTAVVLIMLPCYVGILAASLLVLRYAIVFIQTLRTGRRLSVRGTWAVVPVYDLFSPLYEAGLAVCRRVRRTPGLWR